jgi:hypothetical protein
MWVVDNIVNRSPILTQDGTIAKSHVTVSDQPQFSSRRASCKKVPAEENSFSIRI